jgi:hypothetical protein
LYGLTSSLAIAFDKITQPKGGKIFLNTPNCLLGLWIRNIGEKKNLDDNYSHRKFFPEPSQPILLLSVFNRSYMN